MLFTSIAFLVFLPVVFILYWFVFNKSIFWQNLFLLAASYLFYGWWSWKFLLLLIGSTLLDYFYGFGVASANKKKAKLFLLLSILNNLGILLVFKYYDFFAKQLQSALDIIGLHVNPTFIQIALPVGISFYTFHGMSYIFDIFRSVRKPVANFIDYAVFVCFFPLLIAGPIERSNHLLPQIQSKRIFSYTQAIEGCRLILWGMFKKTFIADNLAPIIETIFADYASFNAFSLIIAAVGLSFQIYCDFSGYSDIAIGISKLLGFEVLSNFRFPYFSRDVAEFWRRWHISLTSWFKDYLYIPMGGSKKGKTIAIRNIFIVFLVSGLWHGADLNFIVWGAIHAIGFLPLLLLKKNRRHISSIVAAEKKLPNIKELFQMLFTFGFVTFAWIFFKIHNLQDSVGYLKQIIVNSFQQPRQYLSIPHGISVLVYIIPVIIADWYLRRNERVLKIPFKPKILRWAFYLIIFLLAILNIEQKREFIYFRF